MHVLHKRQPIEVETTTKPEKLEEWTLKLLFVFFFVLLRLGFFLLEFSTSKQKKSKDKYCRVK